MTPATSSHAEFQRDMRRGYLDGAPGVLVSGIAWLASGAVAVTMSAKAAALALLLGGMLIFPLSVLLAKVLGRSGSHSAGNPLGTLAMEGTFWMLGGIVVACGFLVARPEWFFPAMMLAIGGRYLTFRTLYGLRAYWLLGGTLCCVGLLMGLLRLPAPSVALAGGAVEVVFAAFLFSRAQPAR